MFSSIATESASHDVALNRQRLSKLLQLHGYSACREALVLLEDHYTSSTKYESIEDFISKLNKTITFETDAGSSIIDPDLAHLAIKKLCNQTRRPGEAETIQLETPDEEVTISPPTTLTIKVKNVQYDQTGGDTKTSRNSVASLVSGGGHGQINEFNIHYNFLYKRLSALPIFQGDFKLTKLISLTESSQPSIRCICFGLLIKDVSKIDRYMLIDSTGRVPVQITPDTTFRNRLAYSDCIVLVEGVYVNPDDVLFAANIGLPPILSDPIQDKSLACAEEKLVVILRELFLDDEDVCSSLDMLFSGYNSMEDPPILFILIGDFTRHPCDPELFKSHMKKLTKILRACQNLKDSHFEFIPGQRDVSSVEGHGPNSMPRPPFTKEQVSVNFMKLHNFENIHLGTNPSHVFLGDRQISVVAHSYIKELRKNLLHDLSDHREELFETARQIILSNAHLSAGVSKNYHSSMNLWHKPDLLVLADTEALGNRYDFSKSSQTDTTFTTVPSFSCQHNQFKVYYVKSGEVEDSQVSLDAYKDIEDSEADEDDVQVVEEERSELD